MLPVIAMVVGAIATPLWTAWLWFMVARPAGWEEFVDREHALAVRTGLFSQKCSAFLRPLEKGATAKVLAALGIILGLALIVIPIFSSVLSSSR